MSDAERGAVHHWSESLRVEPDHLFAGRAHLELGEYAQSKLRDAATAARHYRSAIAFDPETRSADTVRALIDLAGLFAPSAPNAGVVGAEEAVAAVARAARGRWEPHHRAILLQLVEAYAAAGHLPETGPAAAAELRAALGG
jgi:hypothetical protein